MTAPNPKLDALRLDPAAREVVRRWRSLTQGGRTLLACSGGADSTALMLVLARFPAHFVVAHIVHDLRPRRQTLADRDFVRSLARRLGLPFREASIRVRRCTGNAEANARRLRYEALARLAVSQSCRFIATAHHADDQVEGVLMRLLRGSGLRGLAAMRPARTLPTPHKTALRLVRPLLRITRTDVERLCRVAGVAWRTDATNADLSRLRAAIRSRVLPVLRELSPGYESRVGQAADLLAQAASMVEARAAAVLRLARNRNSYLAWTRESLRARRPVVLGEVVRRAAISLGARPDRLPRRVIEPIVANIRGNSGERKEHDAGGVRVTIDRTCVLFEKAPRSATKRASATRPRRPSPSAAAAGA